MADLDYYYKYSYGNELASVLPCTLIKSMLQALEHSDTRSGKVIVNFGHAKTLLLLITALGIKHDAERLLASNFEQQQSRQFRMSEFDSFAANFAAVKYNCSSLGNASSSSSSISDSESSNVNNGKAKVLMLLNQVPIEMPWCIAGSICTIDEISQMFYNSGMSNCPHDICGSAFANAKGLDLNYRC